MNYKDCLDHKNYSQTGDLNIKPKSLLENIWDGLSSVSIFWLGNSYKDILDRTDEEALQDDLDAMNGDFVAAARLMGPK